MYRRAAWNWLFAPGGSIQRCRSSHACFHHELSDPPFSGTGRRSPCSCLDRCVDPEHSFHRNRSLLALSASFQSGTAQLSSFHRAAYNSAMKPLPNEWAIKHRADSCAATHRPFVPGEYFYTLLYHDADGYRREDLSEEA